MNQPYRSIEEVPEHLRKSLAEYGVTHKLWSGVLMFCCSFPYCLVMSEDARFLLRHAQEHGIRPTPEEETGGVEAEDTIFEGQILVVPGVSSSASNSEEERKKQ